MRQAQISRQTRETKIDCSFSIDGDKTSSIKTGIGFFDHMLELFTFHGGFSLKLQVEGDLWVDAHHTIEDAGIVLGKALDQALGDRRGIRRYGSFFLPMDETLSLTALDISGRYSHIFQAEFSKTKVGEFPLEMLGHFFASLALESRLTLHQQILYGNNEHHKAEALFKGFGRALKEATTLDSNSSSSTKDLV